MLRLFVVLIAIGGFAYLFLRSATGSRAEPYAFDHCFSPEPVQRRSPGRDEQRDASSIRVALHDGVIVVNDDVARRDKAEQFYKRHGACVDQRVQARRGTSEAVGGEPALQPPLEFGTGGEPRRRVDRALEIVLRQQVTIESGDHSRITFASGALMIVWPTSAKPYACSA